MAPRPTSLPSARVKPSSARWAIASAGFFASSGGVQQPELLAPLIEQVQQQRQEATALIHWSDNPADDESVHAIPLTGQGSHQVAQGFPPQLDRPIEKPGEAEALDILMKIAGSGSTSRISSMLIWLMLA